MNKYQINCIEYAKDISKLMNDKASQALYGELWFPNKYEREWYIINANYCEDKADLLYNELMERPLPEEDVKARMDAWARWILPMVDSLKKFKPLG